MFPRSMSRSGTRAARIGSLLALLLSLSGCMYSFVGGGLPPHVRTVAILPVENETAQPLLETDVERALQAELPRSLGVRLAEEELADAVVRGSIRRYDEVASSVRPSQGEQQVPVVQREVRITYDLEIFDQREDKLLWKATSQTVTGTFLPDNGETAQEGRARALEELVRKVIEGAQSQW